MKAITAMRWTGDDFKFTNAFGEIEEIANMLPEQDRELVLQDSSEWIKH
jgi:hypothetical protein